MNLRNFAIVSALAISLPGFGLVSCKKKKGGISVKVTVDNAKTARIWRDSTGKNVTDSLKRTDSANAESANPARYALENKLLSAADSNANDAQITNVTVSYVDEKGKATTDNNTPNKADFTKDYQIPVGRVISVTAKAKETGTIKTIGELLRGGDASKEYTKDAKDRKTTLTLKVQILKDGTVVGEQFTSATSEVSGTAGATNN